MKTNFYTKYIYHLVQLGRDNHSPGQMQGIRNNKVRFHFKAVYELIPTVEIGKSFKYLGKYYNYDMDDEEPKKDILETACELLHEVNSLPLYSKNKILLYKSKVIMGFHNFRYRYKCHLG